MNALINEGAGRSISERSERLIPLHPKGDAMRAICIIGEDF